MRRSFRKPLVVVAPKKLLKLREACSKVEDFGTDQRFKRVIPERVPDEINSPDKIKTLIICSGQVYYDLRKKRDAEHKDYAIVTLEQIFPMPYDRLKDQLNLYPNLEQVKWVQEEHKNMGSYSFVKPRIDNLLRMIGRENLTLGYAGRAPSASPATGFPALHASEYEKFMTDAFK